MSKLLDDAKAAGFDVSDEQISVHGNSNDLILNDMMAKFAAFQIPDGYKLVPIEPAMLTINKMNIAFDMRKGAPMIEVYQAAIGITSPINTEEK